VSNQPARPPSAAPLRLSYIIGRYPVLTETFIDREIQRLLDLGVDLEIVSIRQPDEQLSPAQRALSARVRYLLPVNLPQLLLAHLSALLGRPRTYLATLAWLLSRPHGDAPRYRTALHFATGVYAAWVLRSRRDVHIHAHFVDRAATVALVAARLLRTTYSVTAHAREIYVSPVLLRERMEHAAFVATCTEYNRNHLARIVGRRHRDKIFRLYHGLPVDGLVDGRRGGSRDAPPLVLAVAQLTERKGLEHLVRALGHLRGQGVAVRCEIVGDGPQRNELEGLVKELDLDGVVALTGPLPYPSVVQRYRRARIFALPCIVTPDGDRDGIPNVILEAMAAGAAVVSTPVSGIPEVIRHEQTGLLVAERDSLGLAAAIQRLLEDGSLRARVVRRGRGFVRREFDVDRNLERLVERFRLASEPQLPSR
jgi:glycosyltransferase involved in cell wall biosynthesis